MNNFIIFASIHRPCLLTMHTWAVFSFSRRQKHDKNHTLLIDCKNNLQLAYYQLLTKVK